VRPDAAMGYQACLNASAEPPAEGNVGAGCGATVGKVLGMGQAMKSGIGSASLRLGPELVIGALAAVNAFGDVVDPSTGKIIAGARKIAAQDIPPTSDDYFADTMQVLNFLAGQNFVFPRGESTVIGVVATNAALNKEQANKVAQMAQDGLARTIRPAHTMLDGDTIFATSLGNQVADVNIIGAFAAEVFAQAVLRAVWAAQPAGGLPSASSLLK